MHSNSRGACGVDQGLVDAKAGFPTEFRRFPYPRGLIFNFAPEVDLNRLVHRL
jgi:hypothetical protein